MSRLCCRINVLSWQTAFERHISTFFNLYCLRMKFQLIQVYISLVGFFIFRIYLTFWYTYQKEFFDLEFLGRNQRSNREILLPVSKWPRKKKNGSKLGCDVIYGSHTSSLQSLEKDLTLFTSFVYNTKSQETQQDISPAVEDSKAWTL